MIIRRTLLILAAMLAILLASGAALMSGKQLSMTLNMVLPEGWEIETPEGLDSDRYGTRLPHFTLRYKDCPLLAVDNTVLKWWKEQSLSLGKATIDYSCIDKLPKSDEQDNAFKMELPVLLAMLPQGEIRIQALHWQNIPKEMPERVKALLRLPSESRLTFSEQKLTLLLTQNNVKAKATLENEHLSITADYTPEKAEKHRLSLSLPIKNFSQFPEQLKAEYHWILPKNVLDMPAFQKGIAELEWQKKGQKWQGTLQIRPHSKQNQLTLPFSFDGKSVFIEQAKVNLDYFPAFPLNAFVTATLTPKSYQFDQIFPIETAIRVSLLSQNEKGKGNVVINNLSGKIDREGMIFPVQINGNIKYDNYILYSAVPLDIRGSWSDLKFKFQQGALLRLTGTERLLTVKDLRFPLAGVTVDKYGITGRLQAIFRGESPDFKQIELHLDGYAKNFKAGALHFFQTPKLKNAVKDQWNWRFWGHTQFNTVKSQLSVDGRGNWHKNLIQLNEFKGSLAQIKQNGIFIPKTELTLLKPIKFYYEKFHLNGSVRLASPLIAFDYGGELLQPKLDLNFNGETENLNMNGLLSSGKLGPIRLFARRHLTADESNLVGRLYWVEQSANVFQSLFPFRNKWIITGGRIKGETAFSVNAKKGLIAGGHFAIRQGDISLPSGEIKGIDFSLPYHYQANYFDLGTKKPVEINIQEINLGIPFTNISAKIQGRYPYTQKKPLQLRELSLNILDGSLNVERFALPQTKIAQLNLYHINLAKILDLAQYHQIKLTGRVNARFPFWLGGKPCYICDGEIEQAGQSFMKFTPELMEAFKKAGYTERILSYTVNDSRINELTAKVNLSTQGEMLLNAKVKTQLIEHEKTKINLNYNHKENMFDLWKLINYGSKIEQQIEHSIYQKLDKKK